MLPPEASTANPVDMLGSASAELYELALPHILADPGVDAVVVIFVPAARVQGARHGAGLSICVLQRDRARCTELTRGCGTARTSW